MGVFALQMQDACEEGPSFEDFWILWARKVAKKDALKEWGKLSTEKQALAIIGAADWRPVWMARIDDGESQYVPHPATWLSGERWDDELPREYRRPERQVQAKVDEGKRVPMPDHVRALIAKLRGK